MKLFSKILIGVLCIATVASVAGVSASWSYAEAPVIRQEKTAQIEVKAFNWEGSTETHGGEGENHKYLLDNMLEDLNSNDSYLEEQIIDRKSSGIFGLYGWDTFGSMDIRDNEDIEALFGLDARALNFLIYAPKGTPNKRYIYTTSVDMGTSQDDIKVPIGTEVYPVYRTTIEFDGETWRGVITELGHAPSKYYDNDWLGSLAVKTPSFDATKWKAGKLGTSTGNAIYSFVGLSTTAYVDAVDEPTYYALSCSKNTNYTITSTLPNVKIEIFYNNSSVKSGQQTVTFSIKQNATCYIRLSGAKDMPFTIS